MNLKQRAFEFLTSGGQYLKTDLIYLIKGGSWLSIAHIIAVFLGFCVSVAFANFFSKESFGNYKYILSMVGILGAFSLTGLSASIVQSVSKGFGNSLRQGFKINLKWSIAILIGGLSLSLYYYIKDNNLLSFSFLLAGILSPIMNSANLYSSYLLGKKDFKTNSFFNTVRNIISATFIIIAILLFQNLPIIITVYFVGGTIISYLLYQWTLHKYKNENNTEDPGLLSYTGHLSAIDIVGRIVGFLDKILVFHYLGAAPLAVYAFAIAPVEQLQGGKKILSSLIKPKVAERSFSELQASAPRKAILLLIYALAIAGVYSFFAPYLYKFIFPQYIDSIFYSQIYSLTLIAIAGTIYQEILIAHKKKTELYFHFTIVPFIQLILFVFLIPYYGIIGLVMAHVTSRFISLISAYCLVTRPQIFNQLVYNPLTSIFIWISKKLFL